MARLLIFLFAFVSAVASAQTPADWWYFGVNAGLHFDGTTPVVDLNGQISTLEGCATISNYDGDLLFYTDGSLVYDSTHTQMPNGFGLLGNSSSSHSAIVAPMPGNADLYYIFTVDATEAAGIEGMRYTIVDMTLNGGLGDVVVDSLNIQLHDSTSEKLGAYPHSNNQDIWVVGHRLHDGDYLSYKLNSNGVVQAPVVSTIGTVLTYPNQGNSISRGCLRFNPGGSEMASSILSENIVEFMDFDRSTGQLSNYRELAVPGLTYGLEFSPSGQYLYVSCWGSGGNVIYQFDVSSGIQSTIQASMATIPRLVFNTSGALQLGLDGKIYFAQVGSQYLGRINEPNNPAATCDYADSAFYLGGMVSRYGLPTFIQSFLIPNFNANDGCFGDSTFFDIDSALITGIAWDFGDPGSGANNTSTLLNPAHLFSDTGSFTVTAIVQVDTISDTVVQEIYIYPRQSIDLGADTTICITDTLLLSARQPFSNYLWSDSSSADTLLVSADTVIWVEVQGVCDTVRDSIRIFYDYPIAINLGPDTLICGKDSHGIAANIVQNAVIQWSTGDSVDAIFVYETGTYQVNAVNTCGSLTDTILVTFKPIPEANFFSDTINCFDNEIVFSHPDLDSTTYIWSDSTTKKNYRVDTTETFWLAAFNECGLTIDTVNVIFNGEIISELGEDTTICDLDTIVLDAYSPGATYLWSTGDTIDTIMNAQVSQLYVVTVTQGLCQTIESKRVDLSNVLCPGIDCSLKVGNVFTPNGDGVNDLFRVRSDCDIETFGLNIYNRWGQLIHHSDNAMYGWDGTVYGEPASEGVYYYELVFKDTVIVAVDNLDFRGSITLIR